MTLEIQRKEQLECGEVYKFKKVKIISSIQDSKFVEQGCLAYLSHVRDFGMDALSIGSIMVVSKFNEVFPNDILGITPDRDI